ncbi:urate hydroxylase PuuD [Pontivivens nitratireducens]|uniref:Urate hydroxylase PuuD n=1 Tax=Pontivivens nitratireducens TaxID=2758038 RepID=A0A6G7VHZ1_9RHOB|nr:urate hydroxylase PuuD [Pontibrevibacter nitratireducens]QIK39614.1 urate hydroxylase PuuD [Pontibrevibacter nitratireducens]
MYEFAIMWDWLALSVRWLHVVTAIAWIGSSFYFIALDLGLNRNIDGPADGEEWQVHGGGFYHIQKYLVAPSAMPEHLTWFKWESYATWLSGVAMLAVVYWAGSELYLIDPAKADLATWQAILLSAGSLAVGWVIYDFLCKSKLGERPTTLMVLLFGLLVVMAWGYDQVFTGRAALLHLGAFTATIMTANVFAIIMPNQRIVVADLKAGRKPDPKYGKIAKLRSTHNNYLTLPVIFLMLSNHYPLAFGTKYNWIIAALVFLAGVTIRHWFNSQHARSGKPTWTWPVTIILVLIMAWLSTEPDFVAEANAAIPARAQGFMQHEQFAAVANTVRGRCSMCHSAEPFYDGIRWAPKGVMLETDTQIATRAREIYLQSGVTHAMPPANVSYMEQTERDMIAQWFEDAR